MNGGVRDWTDIDGLFLFLLTLLCTIVGTIGWRALKRLDTIEREYVTREELDSQHRDDASRLERLLERLESNAIEARAERKNISDRLTDIAVRMGIVEGGRGRPR